MFHHFRQADKVSKYVPTFAALSRPVSPPWRLLGVDHQPGALQRVIAGGPRKRDQGICLGCVVEGGARDP